MTWILKEKKLINNVKIIVSIAIVFIGNNFGQSRVKNINILNSENPNVFISILITLYINRQQAINSKSINNISSGEDIDLAIFFFSQVQGSRRWGSPNRNESRKEMGELQCHCRYGQELAMDITEYSRERRLYADYLIDSRLLAQFWSSILFSEYARNYFSFASGVHYKKSLYSQTEKEKRVIYNSGHTSRKFVQPKEQRQRKKNNKKIQED